jgi:flagellar hook-associated protein 2
VQKVVDAYNAAIDEIKAQTAYDPTSKIAQPLAGISTVMQARMSLSNSIIGSSTTTPSLVGIQTSDDGHIAFDQAKFTAAFLANPATTVALFANPLDPVNPGLADRLKTTILNLTQTGSGSLWQAQKGVQTSIIDVTKQISDYQRHLDQREADLRKQFAALETALTQIKGMGSGLSAMLASSSSSQSSS